MKIKALILFTLFLTSSSTLLAQDSASGPVLYQLFWSEIYPDPDVEEKTQLLGWWLQMEPNGLVWDIISSTERFGEIDLGYGKIINNWSFIGLVGTDFTISKVRLSRFIPQIYGVYWNEERKLRFQSWNLLFLSASKPIIRLKNFFIYQGLGLGVEHNTGNGIDLGPIAEIPFMNGKILPEVRYNTISRDWSFKLTFFIEK